MVTWLVRSDRNGENKSEQSKRLKLPRPKLCSLPMTVRMKLTRYVLPQERGVGVNMSPTLSAPKREELVLGLPSRDSELEAMLTVPERVLPITDPTTLRGKPLLITRRNLLVKAHSGGDIFRLKTYFAEQGKPPDYFVAKGAKGRSSG